MAEKRREGSEREVFVRMGYCQNLALFSAFSLYNSQFLPTAPLKIKYLWSHGGSLLKTSMEQDVLSIVLGCQLWAFELLYSAHNTFIHITHLLKQTITTGYSSGYPWSLKKGNRSSSELHRLTREAYRLKYPQTDEVWSSPAGSL